MLGLLGGLALLGAVWAFVEATSVMHQIFAATLLVAGAVFVVGASVVSALKALPLRQKEFDLHHARLVTEQQAAQHVAPAQRPAA
jgi:hypothetical protein